jgi:uncharacterized membrane protein HdeD (DUF308 family)
MTESTLQRRATPMAMCPMAKACERMMEKPHSGALLMLPGALLIVLGVLIFIEPRIVVWLAGSVALLMGVMFFMMARFIDRLRKPPVGV